MSQDQATTLRTMMKRRTPHSISGTPEPHLFAVFGGRPGVGATTISLNLAIALVQQGQRTVIVDADLARADLAALCGIAAEANVADVLAGKRSIHEVLERGPGGIQLAAGSDSPQCRSLCSERSIGRLLAQVQALGRHAEAVVIDAGSAPTDLAGSIWQATDHVLMVAAPEDVAVMDAYALIKSLSAGEEQTAPLSLVVNQAVSESAALDVQFRMSRSCQRFLGKDVESGGWFPRLSRPSSGPPTAMPWMLMQQSPETAQKMEQLAATLLARHDSTSRDAA